MVVGRWVGFLCVRAYSKVQSGLYKVVHQLTYKRFCSSEKLMVLYIRRIIFKQPILKFSAFIMASN